ncbi:MAG: hypothetical protein K8S25_00890 [Alphaproteobacteria bacterium]|nr:hypothetical protein [Alphaproteobacteria bacterium]
MSENAELAKAFSTLEWPVADLGLPKRAVNALRAGGIERLNDIVEWSEHELRALPNCGAATIEALRTILRRDGLQLKGRAKTV